MASEGTEWRTLIPKKRSATVIAITPSPTASTATEPPTEYSVNRFEALSEATHTPQATSTQKKGNSKGTASTPKDTPKPTAPTAKAKDTAPPLNVPVTATTQPIGPKDYQASKLQSYYPRLAPSL